jgi:hypothetical protein
VKDRDGFDGLEPFGVFFSFFSGGGEVVIHEIGRRRRFRLRGIE